MAETKVVGNRLAQPLNSGDFELAPNVGIGIASPDGTLHIHTASAGSITAAVDGDDFIIENSSEVGMSFLTANNAVARILFGDTDDNDVGRILYSHLVEQMEFTVGTQNPFRLNSTQSLHSDGTAALPGISFISDPDTGIQRQSANRMDFITGGTLKMFLDTGVSVAAGTLRIPDGTAAAPGLRFNSDLDTGMFLGGTNVISFATAGVNRMSIEADGQIRAVDGTATLPAYSFSSDPDTGMFRSASDQLKIVVGGSVRAFFAGTTTTIANATRQVDLLAGTFRPGADNVLNLGAGGVRWIEVFAVAGSINTSHSTTKYDIEALEDIEVPIAVTFKRKGDHGYKKGQEYIGYLNDNLPDNARALNEDGTIDKKGN